MYLPLQSQNLQMITRIIEQIDISQGLQLLLNDFEPDQPLTKTFALNYPHLQLSLQERRNLWKEWICYTIEKQLIIGLFDQCNNNKLVGLSICKDINYDLPVIQEKFTNNLTEQKCFVELEDRLFEGMDPGLQAELKIEGTALDIMIIVVSKTYQGKGLSNLLIAQSEKLGRQKGFKYSHCQASSFKTAKALKRSHYKKLFEVDLHQFVVDGQRPFASISEDDRYPSCWIKILV